MKYFLFIFLLVMVSCGNKYDSINKSQKPIVIINKFEKNCCAKMPCVCYILLCKDSAGNFFEISDKDLYSTFQIGDTIK